MVHQGFVLSPFLFATVVDVVTKLTREDVFSEMLYVDDQDNGEIYEYV